MPDAFLSHLGDFVESRLTHFDGVTRVRDGARVATVRPQSGYWTGVIGIEMVAWGVQNSTINPLGTFNRYQVREPHQLASDLTTNPPHGRYLFQRFNGSFQRSSGVGFSGPVVDYGLPGATGWRVRIRFRSQYAAAAGTLARFWCGRQQYFGVGAVTWFVGVADGVAEYSDIAPADGNEAWSVSQPTVGEWVELVFTTDASYPYLQVMLGFKMALERDLFQVPQLPIEEQDGVRTAAWTEAHHEVCKIEAYFKRRAPMLVLYFVNYGATQLLDTLPTTPGSNGTLTYNAACINALAAAKASYPNRVLVQRLGQPYVELSVTDWGGGILSESIPAQFWVDFTDASATSNAKVSLLWNFGDTHIGTGSPVRHFYEACGTFVTSLQVTDSGEDVFLSNAINGRVLVVVPHASIEWRVVADGAGGFAYAGLVESFTPNNVFHGRFVNGFGFLQRTGEVNCGGPGEAFLWEFGDGATSTDKFPTHTYAAGPGGAMYTLTIRCTVTAANGWAVTHQRSISILTP